MFLILGGVTVGWSFVIFFLLPDTPSKAWFLNQTDRDKAVIRVKENMTGIKNDKFKWSQCVEALLDVKSWFIVAIQIANSIPNGAVTTVCLLLSSISPLLLPFYCKLGDSDRFANKRPFLTTVQRHHHQVVWLQHHEHAPPHQH